MKTHPTTEKIGDDYVTYFSVVSNPNERSLHESIGRIAVEFGRFEYLVKAAIEKLSRELQGTAQINFLDGIALAEKEFTFSKQCDLLGQLFEKREPNAEKKDAFFTFVSEVKKIGEDRNDAVHGCWAGKHNGFYLRLRSHRVRRSDEPMQEAQTVSLTDLENLFKKINASRFLLAASIGFDIGHRVPIAITQARS